MVDHDTPVYYLEMLTGLPMHHDETEAHFRQRVRNRIWMRPPPGTMAAIELSVVAAIDEAKPCGHLPDGDIKRELAVRWLVAFRPEGFWPKLRWAWRMLRRLWE